LDDAIDQNVGQHQISISATSILLVAQKQSAAASWSGRKTDVDEKLTLKAEY